MLYNIGQRKCHNLMCYPTCKCSNVGIWKMKPFSKPIKEKVCSPAPTSEEMKKFKEKLLNYKPSYTGFQIK